MKWLMQILGAGLSLYILVLVIFYFLQEKMIFYPGKAPFGECKGMEQRHAKAVSIGDIRYYIREKPDPENWIIIFHGNAGNGCDRAYFMDLLGDFNSNIVVFEYPGYGNDVNKPGEEIFHQKSLMLIRHLKETDKHNLPVYLLGESIGTGVATFNAGQSDINGLILISPYTSLAGVAGHHYPWLPVNYLMKHKFKAHTWAGQTRTPALLFHGRKDDIIPIRFARQQLLNFKGKKELVEIPDCGHNDLIGTGWSILRQKIRDFLADTM